MGCGWEAGSEISQVPNVHITIHAEGRNAFLVTQAGLDTWVLQHADGKGVKEQAG